MTIFDCFQYFNEEHVADLRFNVLDEFVDFFVIVESTVNHQGKPKKLHFDINKYKKFKDKIIYIVVDDTPEDIKKTSCRRRVFSRTASKKLNSEGFKKLS